MRGVRGAGDLHVCLGVSQDGGPAPGFEPQGDGTQWRRITLDGSELYSSGARSRKPSKEKNGYTADRISSVVKRAGLVVLQDDAGGAALGRVGAAVALARRRGLRRAVAIAGAATAMSTRGMLGEHRHTNVAKARSDAYTTPRSSSRIKSSSRSC